MKDVIGYLKLIYKSDTGKLVESFTIADNILRTSDINLLPAYTAAIISDFRREENLKTGSDF
jgi:hypothetical protein